MLTMATTSFITVEVLGQDNSLIQFKIKKHTQFQKLMGSYADRTGIPLNSLRFRFDGQPIRGCDTPASLDIEDGDMLEVFLVQTGGYHF